MFVDKILGDYEERYFGAGHKRTVYAVGEQLKEESEEYLGCGILKQIEGWSSKNGVNVTPHLSTIDGVILSVLMAEKYISKIYPEIITENLFVNSFEIKAGATPIEDLDSIPIRLKKVIFEGEKIFASIEVLNMKVKLELTNYTKAVMKIPKYKIEKGDSYFSDHLKSLRHDIINIDFLTPTTAICEVTRTEYFLENYLGIESAHILSMSVLEWLVIFSQFAQLLTYNFDYMNRCDSDTLWMRSVKAEIKEPFSYEEPIITSGEIVKSSIVKKGEDSWRLLEMKGSTIDENVEFEGKLAHRLPTLTGVVD